MKITSPKWVRRANQWCVTTLEKTSGMGSKHTIKQTQYWFSTEAEAITKHQELSAISNEPKNS